MSMEEIERKQEKERMNNSKRKDSFGKMIFGNHELCAQFLREYTNIEQLKNVQPEDIEDISNRFTHMFTEEREADVIKKINIAEDEITFYLISLIEHKSQVDYNVVMQILRYMVFIQEDYEKRENGKTKGISKTKQFKKLAVEIPPEYFAQITENTSQNVMDIMISVMRVLLSKLKLPEEEIDSFVEKIKEEDNVGGWFEHFKEID